MKATRNLLSVLILMAATVASATTFTDLTDRQLIDRSDVVVQGTIAGASARSLASGSIVTDYRFVVEESVKGTFPAGTELTISELGGQIGHQFVLVSDGAAYAPGEHVLTFLRHRDDGTWYTSAMDRGKFVIQNRGSDSLAIRTSSELGAEKPRIRQKFVDYIRNVSRGIETEARYRAENVASEATRPIKVGNDGSAPLYCIVNPNNNRPLRLPGGSVTFKVRGTEPNVSNAMGGITSAASAWNGDANSSVNISIGGNSSLSTATPNDTEKTISIGDDRSVPPNEGACDGAVGCTIYSGDDSTSHVFNGDTFQSITEVDIIIRSSITSQSLFNTTMTHEFGHSIGLRHSNESGRTPATSSAVMATPFLSTIGANLLQWDKDAVDTVYGSGPVCAAPTITSQSGNTTVQAGHSANLNVSATGTAPLSYQWYQGNAGDTSTPVGTNSNSYTTPVINSPMSFWVRVTSSCSSTVDSATINVSVGSCVTPTITAAPQNVTITPGSSATLTVGHNGTGPFTYQWYQGTTGTTSAPVGGANAISFMTPVLTQTTSYWVRVTGSCGAVDSPTVTVTVSATCASPVFTSPALSTTTPPGGGYAVFTATASNSPQYEWFQGNSGDTSTPVASIAPSDNRFAQMLYITLLGRPGTTTELNFVVGLLNTMTRVDAAASLETSAEYRSVLINRFYTTYLSRTPTTDETNYLLSVFGAEATDEFIEAQIISSDEFYDLSGNSDSGWVTRLYTGALGRTPTSAEIASATAQLASFPRTFVALSILASHEGLSRVTAQTYRAFLHRDPTTAEVASAIDILTSTSAERFRATVLGSDEFNQSGSVLITPLLSATTNYWVRAHNSCGTVNGDTVTATVPGCKPSIDFGPYGGAVIPGQAITLSVSVSGIGPLSYQWYKGSTGDTSHPVGNANEPSLTVIPSFTPGSTLYYVRVTNSCGSTDSAPATVSVSCSTPTKPVLSTPPTATSKVPYHVGFDAIYVLSTKYELQESTSPDFTNPKLFTLTENGATIPAHTELTADTRFYYRVRAFALCNGQASDYSITSSTVVTASVPVPLQPMEFASQPGSNDVITQQIFISGSGAVGKTALAADQFTITADKPFVSFSPASGALPAEGVTVTMTLNPAGFDIGSTTASITVTKTQGGSGKTALSTSTTTVPVSISVVTPVIPTAKDLNAPANTLVIPAVAYADGAGGSHFQSDVRITNTGTSSMNYLLTFTPTNTDGTKAGKQTNLTIAPSETKALNDVVKVWFGAGVAGEAGIGSLEIRPLTSTLAQATVASSRTFNVTSAGTFGQFIPAIALSAFLANGGASKISLQQMASSAAYRTNVGFAEGSGHSATMLLKLFDDHGTVIGSNTLSLQPYEQRQLPLTSLFAGASVTDGRMEVSVTTTAGKVTAYSSVLDNKTNDPLLVFPVQPQTVATTRYVVPGVAELNNGAANFHTDMRVYNGGTAPMNATLNFYPQSGAAPSPVNISVAPGEVKALDNVLPSVFSVASGGGSVLVSTAANSSLVVTARTFSRRDDGGTFGQFIPAVSPNDATGAGGRTIHVLQLEQSPSFRSNVGLVEVSGAPAKVQLSGFVPDSKVAANVVIDLAPNQFTQINAILAQMGFSNTYNGRISVKVLSGTGKVAAYGSVIDNATQDPTYVPAQ